jgi:hypothetical protein
VLSAGANDNVRTMFYDAAICPVESQPRQQTQKEGAVDADESATQ